MQEYDDDDDGRGIGGSGGGGGSGKEFSTSTSPDPSATYATAPTGVGAPEPSPVVNAPKDLSTLHYGEGEGLVPVSGAPRVIRTTQDVLAVVQERNPKVQPFEHEGRVCIDYYEFHMAVCGVAHGAAKTAKKRLVKNHPHAAELIKKDPFVGESTLVIL